MSTLSDLVHQAKTDPAAATGKLTVFLKDIFPDLHVKGCTINTGSKVSLNSVNGTLTTSDNHTYFFKFHAEEGEQQSLIAAEYYRAQTLSDAGWPIVKPVAVSTAPGKQCVVYPMLDAATAYDLYGAQDTLYLAHGAYDPAQYALLLRAEKDYLEKTTAIVLKTLQPGSAENASTPLHQLFSHRLHAVQGSTPRIDLFYTGKPVTLPDGNIMNFDDVALKKMQVNGTLYPHTLADIIALSKQHLHHDAMAQHPSCLSHGDDHNGNKFLIGDTFIAFDPAFGGRHPVLLGLIKGVMHNAPLHPFWYYEPERIHDRLKLDFKISGDILDITHNGADVLRSPLRDAVTALHQNMVWAPVLQQLKEKRMLPETWELFSRCAAFCCPFLALNMINPQRYSAAQLSLFNLAQCMAAFHLPFFDTLKKTLSASG